MLPTVNEAPHASTALATPPRSAASAVAVRGDVLQALLLLAPAAILGWPGPGAFLDSDFLPAATGAAVALLVTLASTLVLCLRRHAGSARGWIWLLPLATALAGTFVVDSDGPSVDSFERDRALAIVLVALAQLAGGASLGERGRYVLARGLSVLAIVYAAFALGDGANKFAGALGNTGSTSQALLAGAVAGGCLLADRRSPWSLVHALALVLQLAYVARVPVIAGALACGGALACFALVASVSKRARLAFGALSLLAIGAAIAPFVRERAAAAPAASATTDATSGAKSLPQAAASADSGGFDVRRRIWRASLGLIGEHPLLGAGLGQFARAFPPHRDPQEIERSSFARRIAQETEVEHAHCDWITLACEAGLVRAALALVFVALLLAAVWRALRGASRLDAALAAAALALLANSLVHGVLFHDPVSSSLAFAVFGAVLGPRAGPARLVTKVVPWLVAALLASQVPAALATIRHTRAMQPLYRGAPLSTEDTRAAIESALEARPDSTLAATFRARFLEQQRAQLPLVVGAWKQVLAYRPLRVEARMQSALAQLQLGAREQARADWETALSLDPLHPGALWNLMTLAFEEERVDEALGYLARLEARGSADHDRLVTLAARQELYGRDASAAAIFARAAPEYATSDARRAFDLAAERRLVNDGLIAAALEFRAQRAWAREHVSAGSFGDAVRSYRQALRQTAVVEALGAARIRLEYAAALVAAGKVDEAEGEVEKLEFTTSDLAALPEWARVTVAERGWERRATGP